MRRERYDLVAVLEVPERVVLPERLPDPLDLGAGGGLLDLEDVLRPDQVLTVLYKVVDLILDVLGELHVLPGILDFGELPEVLDALGDRREVHLQLLLLALDGWDELRLDLLHGQAHLLQASLDLQREGLDELEALDELRVVAHAREVGDLDELHGESDVGGQLVQLLLQHRPVDEVVELHKRVQLGDLLIQVVEDLLEDALGLDGQLLDPRLDACGR